MICCLNGKFLDQKDAKIPLMDNGFMFGDGFFDTMRAVGNVVLELENHLERIEKTSKILHLNLPYSMQDLESWIRKTLKINKLTQSRIRVTISRGANGFDFFSSKNPTVAITCDNYPKDENLTENGVQTFTFNSQRTLPEIKTTNMAYMIQAHYKLIEKKGFEAILIDDLGYVREGSFMNIFMIKNGKIFTPKDKILAGITRARIIQLAKKMKLKLEIKNFKKPELFKAEEIFLSNSLREIVPVTKVDNKKIGTGNPGSITKKIIAAYKEFTEEYISSHLKDYI